MATPPADSGAPALWLPFRWSLLPRTAWGPTGKGAEGGSTISPQKTLMEQFRVGHVPSHTPSKAGRGQRRSHQESGGGTKYGRKGGWRAATENFRKPRWGPQTDDVPSHRMSGSSSGRREIAHKAQGAVCASVCTRAAARRPHLPKTARPQLRSKAALCCCRRNPPLRLTRSPAQGSALGHERWQWPWRGGRAPPVPLGAGQAVSTDGQGA